MPINALIEPAVLSEICGEIAALLNAEIAVGNAVEETSRAGPLSLGVLSSMIGVHCATMPIAVIRLILRHPLTDIGLEKFVSDAKKNAGKAK